MNIVLLPLQIDSALVQVVNTKAVLTNALRISAYNTYISLLKAENNRNVQRDLMSGFYADYRKAQLQESLGMISPTELRLIEIDYLKARYSNDSAQRAFESALMAVNKLIGEDLAKQYARYQDQNIQSAPLRSLDSYVKMALENRNEVVNARNALDYQEKAFELGTSVLQQDYNFFVQQQKYELENAQNNLELALNKVELSVVNLYSTLESASKNVTANRDMSEQAALAYQAAEVRFRNSQITARDLNSAKVRKAQADISYKNAQLDFWLVQAMMNSACGIGYQM